MTNLNIFENTFAIRPVWKLNKDQPDNCSGNCPTQIQKRLPFWINQQPYWTYQCLCCSAYQFEVGEVFKGDFYEL